MIFFELNVFQQGETDQKVLRTGDIGFRRRGLGNRKDTAKAWRGGLPTPYNTPPNNAYNHSPARSTSALSPPRRRKWETGPGIFCCRACGNSRLCALHGRRWPAQGCLRSNGPCSLTAVILKVGFRGEGP